MYKGEIRCNAFSFLCNNRKFFTLKQVFFSMRLNPEDTKVFKKVISEGITAGYILEKDGKIKIGDNISYGYISIDKSGTYYAHCNNEKYLLDTNGKTNIFWGDQVLINITDKLLLKGNFLTILKHKGSKIRGTIMDRENFAFLIPDDAEKYPSDVFISKKDSSLEVEQYDRVIVQINEFDINGQPRGKVLYKLENSDIVEDPLEMIIEKYGIEKDFPSEVLRKAGALKKRISCENYNRRIDLTDELIYTIDGENSKDFDDAISVKRVGDNYELGVYIADVTAYVEEGSILDKAAFNRGTSYYFIDKAIPMLPKELSNNLCSLNPAEKKLCVGVKMIIDKTGKILDREFFECIICSHRRFTYEEINSWLRGEEKLEEDSQEILESLTIGIELAEILHKKRLSRSSLMFEFDSIDFAIDDSGKVVDMFPYDRGTSNRMIEEFMIAANEMVAELFSELKFPFIYRIHDEPFEERLETFFETCKSYGIDVPPDPKVEDLSGIVESIKDINLRRGIEMNLITTMKQAKYSGENIGHFGLASKAYCHFTSPIRRYPDIYNHRLLKRYIRKTLNNDSLREYVDKSIQKVASHCCYTERNAAKAEDEYDKIKTLEYLLENSSNEYEALVYSISSKGMYVLINNCVAGFIRCKDIKFDEKRFCGVIGEKEYKIGSVVKVFFSEFDAKNKRLLFGIVEEK